MKAYRIIRTSTISITTVVEAESPTKALEIANGNDVAWPERTASTMVSRVVDLENGATVLTTTDLPTEGKIE